MTTINFKDMRNEVTILHPSVVLRVARSYVDMHSATKEFLAERPSEARLLLFIILSDMVFTLSWAMKALSSPTTTATATMRTDIVLWLIVASMVRTTGVYALALGVGLGMKLVGGKATLRETRAGVIWGVFVAAPIGLAISVLAVLISEFDGAFKFLQSDGIQMTPYWLGLVPFVWFVAKGAATANRIDNAVPIFGVISAIFVTLAYGVNYLAM